MKKYSIYFTLITGWLLLSGCPEDKPDVPKRDTTIHLTEVSTGIFSVRLKITVADTSDSWTFELNRDDSTILISEVFSSDTIIKDNSLSNITQYTYRAFWLIDSERVDSSETVTILTGDTTSHNFIWEIDTLGIYGSYLNDVAIVDENNIWVVGNIETDSGSYNAAHWNGSEWELMGIYSNTLDLYSIQYFNENDIWVLASYPIHWDGNEWTHFHLTDMGIILGGLRGEIWGSGPNDVYFVGSTGRIVHYDGSVFTKMESGTDMDLTDVWGNLNTSTGQYDIWASGNTSDLNQSIILRNHNNVWNTVIETDYLETLMELPEDTLYADISGIWDGGQDSLWITGSWGVFKMSKVNYSFRWVYQRRWDQPGPFEAGRPYRIRGSGENNVFILGQTGTLLHYNGRTWHLYQEFYQPYLWFFSIAVTDNEVVAVGTTPANQGIIIRGMR